RAWHTFAEINAHAEQIKVANMLIEHKAFVPNFYYWRGLGLMKKGDHAAALDDFITTVELSPQLERVSSAVFMHQAKMYENLDRVCEAITPIQTWVSLDPVNRETSQSRGLIARYEQQGKCASSYTSGTAKIRQSGSKAILVRAKINGVSGKFVLDTGASYVSVNRAFAERAKLREVDGSKVLLRTANGITVGRVAVADTISVQKATADKVTVVTLGDAKEQLGKQIDGLLGLSFLARFDMKFANGTWTLKARSATQ
ncbi:MAG: retropepsin-like aspartic protease, partial [Pseudomonadota bacterium]